MEIRDGFAEIFKREIGLSRPRCFARRLSASEVIVKKLNGFGELNGHKGCVNAIEFNSTGDLLVSGSDDTEVMFWDWATTTRRLSYPSGHSDNIFQTKFMPLSDDRTIVTSARDGQIRLGQVSEDGKVDTKLLGTHEGHVFKLAIEPGSPHIFYSCGEDGYVQHFDLRSNFPTKLFYCTSLTENNRQPRNSIGLNAIVIDPRNPHYLAVGGDDEYARLYDIRQCRENASSISDKPVNTFCPRHLVETNNVHITGLAYSNASELLVSYNDEHIYLFQKNMGLGPSPSSASFENMLEMEEPQAYTGHRNSHTVKGVSFFGPNDDYVLTGSDGGHIFIWRKKGAKLVRLMVGDRRVVNQLEPHPHMPFLATCGIESKIKLWTPRATNDPPVPDDVEKIIESNKRGRGDQSQVVLTPDVVMHVLRLQRRQTLAYIERRHRGADVESDEENGGPSTLGTSDEDGSGDCYIS
ncbi:hypothetical protein UlMin_013616 [Ulmus minor]